MLAMLKWAVLAGFVICLVKVCHSQDSLCSDVVANLDCSLDPPRNICGTDGVTYPTSCDFAKAHCANPDLHIKYEGQCLDTDVPDPICGSLVGISCPTYPNLICASDGKTYDNFCFYEQAKCKQPGLSLINLGHCPTAQPTVPSTTLSIFELVCQLILSSDCPKGEPQVCGSDGVTYNSGCDLEKANCLADGNISLVSEGPC